jgi:TusA-related sulfurtransferase
VLLPIQAQRLLDENPGLQLIDARGLRCPLPVLRLGKAARETDAVAFLVLATDPAARQDIPAFCAEKNWECVAQDVVAPAIVYIVRGDVTIGHHAAIV